MTKSKNISAFQFFVMLFLTRTLTTVTYLSSYTEDIRLSDMLIHPIFRVLFGTLMMIPVYLLYRKHGEQNLIEIIENRSKVLAKFVSAVFVLYFFYFTVVTIARLDLFAGTVVFPETDVEYILIFAIIICCYGAYLGLEALGRSSVVSAIFVIPALIFIMLTLTDKVDFLNLTPLFYNGVTPVIKVAIDSVGQTVEYGIIALMMPRVTGKYRKGYYIWLFSQVFLMAIMASLAEFSMFTRLDAIFTGVWIMCAFIKAGLLIYLQSELLEKHFGKFRKGQYVVAIGVLTIIANLIISQRIEWFKVIDDSRIKVIITGISVLIIPLFTLILKGGRSKKCEKQV